jgi:predicted phage terminase large subunit-like protein
MSFPEMEQNPDNPFSDDDYFGPVAEHAQAVIDGRIRRLVVTQPPGTLKSKTWLVALVSWAWIDLPHLKFLCAGNEMDLSMRDSVACRKLLRSEWYQSNFRPGWRFTDDQDAKKLFNNSAGGFRQCTSSGSAVAGKKADVILVDDLHDAAQVHRPAIREADCFWFDNTLWDRQNDFTRSAIVVIAHPLHPSDATQRLIARGWPHLALCERMEGRLRKVFPLGGTDPRADGVYLRPTRFGPMQEADVKANSGESVWEAKYQGRPRVVEGSMFPKERVNILSAIPSGFEAVRYWDTAATKNETSCHSSGVLLGRYPHPVLPGHFRWAVADVVRGKWTWSERDTVIRQTAEADRWRSNCRVAEIVIEHPGGSGGVQVAEIVVSSLAGFNVSIDPPTQDKVTRAGPLSAQWAAGNVDLVAGPWNAAYLDRMENFPGLPDKDDTDASSGAFNRQALRGKPDETPLARPNPVDSLPRGTLPGGKVDARNARF